MSLLFRKFSNTLQIIKNAFLRLWNYISYKLLARKKSKEEQMPFAQDTQNTPPELQENNTPKEEPQVPPSLSNGATQKEEIQTPEQVLEQQAANNKTIIQDIQSIVEEANTTTTLANPELQNNTPKEEPQNLPPSPSNGATQKEEAEKLEIWKGQILQDEELLCARDEEGDTPFILAIKDRNLDRVRWILALYQDKKSEPTFLKKILGQLGYKYGGKIYSSPLIWAAKVNDLGIIKELLKSLIKPPKGGLYPMLLLTDIRAIYNYQNEIGESFSTLFNANNPDKEALKANRELTSLLTQVESFVEAAANTPISNKQMRAR